MAFFGVTDVFFFGVVYAFLILFGGCFFEDVKWWKLAKNEDLFAS